MNQSKVSHFLDTYFLENFSIPVEKNSILWSQIYEGIPVVFQKNSRISKALKKIITTWI